MKKRQPQSNSATSDNAKYRPSASRRKFVKGTAAAVPTVMTLYSGAAEATASISCQQKLEGLQPDLFIEKWEDDTMWRTDVKVRTYKKDYKKKTVYEDKTTGGTKWRDFTNGSSVDIYKLERKGWKIHKKKTKKALVFVDDNGRKVGLAHKPNYGNFISHSCWTSIA